MLSRATKYFHGHGDPVKRDGSSPSPSEYAHGPRRSSNLTRLREVDTLGGAESIDAVLKTTVETPRSRFIDCLLHAKQSILPLLTSPPSTEEPQRHEIRARLPRMHERMPRQPHNTHANSQESRVGVSASMVTLAWDTESAPHMHAVLAVKPDLIIDTIGSSSESPMSPSSPCSRSDGVCSESEAGSYSTPMTSPDCSPIAKNPKWTDLGHHLDGAGSSVVMADEANKVYDPSGETNVVAVSHELPHGLSAIPTSAVDLYAADSSVEVLPETGFGDDQSPDFVSLCRAGAAAQDLGIFARNTRALPRTPSRHPTLLLSHRDRNISPSQRKLIRAGIAFPDRFVPSRESTPTKEAFFTAQWSKSCPASQSNADPFAPNTGRSIRIAEQYATLRAPTPPLRPTGLTASRVPEAQATTLRSSSTSSGWSVAGVAVTEGILSTTNGRGGRVTSGTSAPHYSADFLRKRSQADDQTVHGRRLAHAMELRPADRMMFNPSSVSRLSLDPGEGRQSTPQLVTWRDGKWEAPTKSIPSSPLVSKTRKIPVVPYRVLDAPSLRDDYYCSLLAFSQTLSCLAVGLGPHVYLWSESRGTTPTNIPDAYTAFRGASHVTSLSFSSTRGGKAVLAIGRAEGRITLWSPRNHGAKLDRQQPSPVSCVSFRPTTSRRRSIRDPLIFTDTEELLAGDEVGNVYLYSIEWPTEDQRDLFDWHGSMTLLAKISCHSQQICGMTWNATGELFATGGNDNHLFLFETKKVLKRPSRKRNMGNTSGSDSSNLANDLANGPIYILPGQQSQTFALNAACKALAFAPWQPTLLAAGGGSNDRCIHFFACSTGARLATLDCYAQVTSIVFNSQRKEFAATFGFAQPEHAIRVAVFAWPSCELRVKVPWWGEERALYAVEYFGKGEGGEGSLVVATSDASIKFHEVWSKGSSGSGGKADRGWRLGGGILDDDLSVRPEDVLR